MLSRPADALSLNIEVEDNYQREIVSFNELSD